MEIKFQFAVILKLEYPPIIGEVPEGFDLIKKSHITLIGGQALKQFKEQIKKHFSVSANRMWTVCPEFGSKFSIATREEIPVDKGNPALGVETRKTLFLPILNQDEVRDYVNRICEELGIENPEPDRFYHISLANNHGGDPFKSVGDINKEDVRVRPKTQ